MKNREVYKRTKCFAWPRVPYAVAGAFAIIWFPAITYILLNGKEGAFANFLMVVMTVLGIFIAKQISTWGTKRARIAQISMISRGVALRVLPENVKAEGFRIAKRHFENITNGDMAKRALKKAYAKRTGKIADDINLLPELKDFLELFALNLIPYAGECMLAWEFVYPGTTLEESMCDSLEVLAKNWLRMLVTIILQILMIACFVFGGTLVLSVIIYAIGDNHPVLKESVDKLAAPAVSSKDYASFGENAVLGFIIILIISALLPFVLSRMRVWTLDTFFKCADRKPPTGKIYAKLGERIKRMKKEADESN